MNEAQEETVKWYGHAHPEEHRTVGDRAWCLTCQEWCYQTAGCRCCLEPTESQKRVAALEDKLRIAVEGLREIAQGSRVYGSSSPQQIVARILRELGE